MKTLSSLAHSEHLHRLAISGWRWYSAAHMPSVMQVGRTVSARYRSGYSSCLVSQQPAAGELSINSVLSTHTSPNDKQELSKCWDSRPWRSKVDNRS